MKRTGNLLWSMDRPKRLAPRRNPASFAHIREKYEHCITKVKKKPARSAYGICTASMYRAYGKDRVTAALKPVRAKAAKKAAATRAKKRKNPYTDPGLHERIKRRVMAGSAGGRPGQWSARKAQIVANEYRSHGGEYTGRKSKAQKSLSRWTAQDWTTSDDKPAIRKGGTARYLPRDAWKLLSLREIEATNAKKRAGSRQGKQFVPNTPAAKKAAALVRRRSR